MSIAVDEIPGFSGLCEWYGGVPSFYDGYGALRLSGDGAAELVIHAFRITNRVDANGHFVQDKHFVATFVFEGIENLSLAGLQPGMNIIHSLGVEQTGATLLMTIESSYGFSGCIKARAIRLAFEPSRPGPA